MDTAIHADTDGVKEAAAIAEITALKSEIKDVFASEFKKLGQVKEELSSYSQKMLDSAINCTSLVYHFEERMTAQPSPVKQQFISFTSVMLVGLFCLVVFLAVSGINEVNVLTKRIEFFERDVTESRLKQATLEMKLADSVQKLAVLTSLLYDLKERQVVRDTKLSDLAEKLLAFDSLFWDVKEKQHVGDSMISQVGKKLEFGDAILAEVRERLGIAEYVMSDVSDKLKAGETKLAYYILAEVKERLGLAEFKVSEFRESLKVGETRMMRLETSLSEIQRKFQKL